MFLPWIKLKMIRYAYLFRHLVTYYENYSLCVKTHSIYDVIIKLH